MTYRCSCHLDSPFMWAHKARPSIFSTEKSFKPHGGSGLPLSAHQTGVIERERNAGRHLGTIHGISGNKEKERLRVKDFHVYAKANAPVGLKPSVKAKAKAKNPTIHRD